MAQLRTYIQSFFYYFLLLMLKIKSDRLIKKDFLAKSKLKLEMKKSREKLSMLMPEFVLERINNFEASGMKDLTIRKLHR